MGHGASAVPRRLLDCSPQDLQAVIHELSPEAHEKLQAALISVEVHPLRGMWRAARVTEWGPCSVSVDQRVKHFVYDFDNAGKFQAPHNPEEFGQVKAGESANIFEGNCSLSGTQMPLTIKLLPGGDSMEFHLALGGMKTLWFLDRVPESEFKHTPAGDFHQAVQHGDQEKVQKILASADAEALLMAKDPCGSTALHKAAYSQQVEIARLILEGAREPDALLTAVSNFGSTALHAAASLGAKDMCFLMLSHARDAASMLKLVNLGGQTPFSMTDEFSTAHCLCTHRPPAQVEWPEPEAILEHAEHLHLGLSSQCSDEALVALESHLYKRDEKQLHWVTSAFGNTFTGYDACDLVKRHFKNRVGYKAFSAVEVMVSCQHPGAGPAEVFLSHAQKEPVSTTLDAMKRYELRKMKSIRFFVDIFCLRQCVQDFVLDAVKEAIRAIGCTVMMAEPWRQPFTLLRTFCAFEIYVTVDAQVALEVVTPGSELVDMLAEMCSSAAAEALQSVSVDIEKADARDPLDKKAIDDFIIAGPGFERTNRTTEEAIQGALLIQGHQNEKSGKLSLEMLGQALMGMGPSLAARVAATPGAHGQTMVHRLCTSSPWIPRLPAIFGGKVQSLLMAEDAQGRTSLAILVSSDAEADIMSLLDAAEDPEALISQALGEANTNPGMLLLGSAAAYGLLGACRALLKKSSNTQARLEQENPSGPRKGWTALMHAAGTGQLEICELFLAEAKDPQALVQQISSCGDFEGRAALHLAVFGGVREVIQLLMATAKDLQALLHQRAVHEKRRGTTVLHYAAGLGKVEACKLLLTDVKDLDTLLLYKGSMQTMGMQGGLALHFAAGMGHTEVAQTILDCAPNPRVLLQAEDTNGLTPAMLAEARGHENMVQLLEGAIVRDTK